jgi:Domain of unknown function (DUF4279)
MTDQMFTTSRFTAVNDAEAACERTCAKLLIYSPTLTPTEITELLGGLQPTSQVFSREPSGEYPGRANGWFLSSEGAVASKDLRTHLDWLLKVLSPLVSLLSELQRRTGTRMYVHCPWWGRFDSGGPSLWPEQMRSLADLNLECTIDFAHYNAQEEV